MNALSYLQRFGDVELAVRASGKGIPFIWGHSLMGSMQVEDRAELWDWCNLERHAQVVRYDARGHGNSDGSYRKEDYQWEHMAADMLAVAESFTTGRRKRYILGGMSMGAATALEAALRAPDKVAGLVLALPPTAWATRPRQAVVYRRLAQVSGWFGAAPYRLLDLLPKPIRQDGRSLLALNTMKSLAQANPLHVQATLGGAALSDMAEPDQFARLKVPTLILAWEDDTAHPLSTAETLAATLPNLHELVICDPTDITEWEEAMVTFVKQISAKATRRKAGRGRAGKSKGQAAA
jgi:pimeloyl-ACP methyl ester carboxylesterase